MASLSLWARNPAGQWSWFQCWLQGKLEGIFIETKFTEISSQNSGASIWSRPPEPVMTLPEWAHELIGPWVHGPKTFLKNMFF